MRAWRLVVVVCALGLACRPRPGPIPVAGAPAAVADADRDGIAGDRDACPDDAEDRDDALDGDGCPELDADGDGVLDACDHCPEAPERYNHYEDEDGCPELVHPREDDGVFFEQNEAVLDEWSISALQYFVELLVHQPDIERIAVVARAGATEHMPIPLSQRRAAAVIAVLTAAGLDPGRIDIVAVGAVPPVADGRDLERLGRRAYLVVVRSDGDDVALADGQVIMLMARWPPPPPQPSPPRCPTR